MKNKHLHYHKKNRIEFKILGVLFVVLALAAIVSVVILWQVSTIEFPPDSFPIHKLAK